MRFPYEGDIEGIAIQAVEKELRICALHLHGSEVRDELRPDPISDIDLSVITQPGSVVPRRDVTKSSTSLSYSIPDSE